MMKISRLKNNANKTKDPNDIRNYKKRNHVNLNKMAKPEYFNKYNSIDNNPFWLNSKPYLN